MRKTFTLFILSFILIGATPPADPENGPTIIRSFSNLYLGMSIAEMEDAYPVDEIAAGSLLPGEKMFAVYARFPEINKVLATFYLGKLFRIELFYSPDYAKRVPWERFVSVVRKGYGEGWSFEAQGGPVVMWDDGETSFVLERKTVPRTSSPYPYYLASIVDGELFNARQESCPARKYEA